LNFLSRVSPRSQSLQEYCLNIINDEKDISQCKTVPEIELAITAAKILGTHFSGDNEILKLLTQKSVEAISEKVIITLSEGWPSCKKIKDFLSFLCENKRRTHKITDIYLICYKTKTNFVYNHLMDMINNTTFCQSWYSQTITNTFIKRIQKDDKLFDMLLKKLKNSPTASEKATITKFITYSRGISNDIRNFCIEEINKQLKNNDPPEIGFDLFYGKVRPVIYSLLEAIYQQY